MTTQDDTSEALLAAVNHAVRHQVCLDIQGGLSKAFYGRASEGEPLDLCSHRGIISYEPSELVITARAGTPLQEIEQILAAQGQMLAFEPPHFSLATTLGGSIACGFSGPSRPYRGAARDFVLGVKMINGLGELVHFGGAVMKNVAGYDVARLMCGAMGTLGVLLEISLKVLPRPQAQTTLVYHLGLDQALDKMAQLAQQSLPLSGMCFVEGGLYMRLSGTEQGLSAAAGRLTGDVISDGDQFWRDLNAQQLEFFSSPAPLWRISVAPHAPLLELPGEWLLDWGGAQRWLKSTAAAQELRAMVERQGGHATLFRGGDRSGDLLHPLSAPLSQLHRRVKAAFDPHGIFNQGRMYAEL